MPNDQYLSECRAKWVEAIHEAVGKTPPRTSVWRGPNAIVKAIEPFLSAANHLHFADGGGHDLAGVALGHEAGTVEFIIRDKFVYVAKPSAMTLEYIEADPAQSFLTIDVDHLEPSGVYEADDEVIRRRRGEELVELAPGEYAERAVWDAGYTHHDEDGAEVPLPEDSRLVHRILDGRLLLVTKGSIWNSMPETYDGRHDCMANDDIRNVIERLVDVSENA